MKRSRCERSAVTPTSSHYAGNVADTAQINGEPAAGADNTEPPEQPAAAGQTGEQAGAAALQPMPFPGPFAYMPVPAVIAQESAGTATPAPVPMTTADCGARGPVMSTSTSVPEPGENPHGLPPLLWAAERGDLPEVRALLGSGATDVNQLDGKYGVSALMVAAQLGHAEVAAALLAAGAQVNLAGVSNGVTALMCAARSGNAEVVQMLLKHPGTAVDQRDNAGRTALIFAAWKNKPDAVACLLAAGAQVNLANANDGGTALTYAADYGHVQVVEMLLNHPGTAVDQPNGFGKTALMCAAAKNKPDAVACLLVAGAQVNLANANDGGTALMIAAASGNAEVVRMLLAHPGIAVDQRDNAGNTALMHAAAKNKPDAVAWLLAARAQVNLADTKIGATALLIAAASGNAEVVQMLLKHPGIAVDQRDNAGNTALMLAAWNNKPDAVARLLAARAQVNLANANDGGTALTYAAASGQVQAVQMLLQHPGIALDQRDNAGYTALMFAAWKNKPDAVACLLAAGAFMNAVNRIGDTPLSLAVKQAHAATIEVFLLHGAQFQGQGLDFFQSAPNPNTAAIADLWAERDMPAPELLATAQAQAFFRELISTLQEDGAMQPLMRWLRSKGIRMACAQQVAVALSGAHAAWRLHPGGVKPANTQQLTSYCLGALGSLGIQGGNSKVLAVYQAAGISAAAIKRLGGTACGQLDNLAGLASEVAAQVGGDMLDGLVDACLAKTGPEYRVDADALKARLVEDGYCAPLAEAIALSWKEAIAGAQEQRIAIPDALTLAQIAQFVHSQIVAQAPALFASAMQRQLDSRERLSSLGSMMGGSNDEGLHALFQLQCDQLRQYCAQLLEQEKPDVARSSKD